MVLWLTFINDSKTERLSMFSVIKWYINLIKLLHKILYTQINFLYSFACIVQYIGWKHKSIKLVSVIYEGHSGFFFPFAFKARSTTLIFVECITIHQTSLLDDVHKVLAVFTGTKLCFWYVFENTPHIMKYSRSGLTLTLKLPAWKSFLWFGK